MKVSSRGPIVRWALSRPTSGLVSSPSEWRCGRDLSDEEKHSGLLLRIRDICQPLAKNDQLPVAVVKAQPSDLQVNEVDAVGDVAALSKVVKGKWRKISRQKTLLIEDDARTPFSDPSKSFSPRVQSYGEYVRLTGKLPRDLPVLRFVLYRDSYSLNSVENRLGYVLSLQPDCVFLRDQPGGSFGCITQHGVCLGVTKEILSHASRHYNLHPLIFEPREYFSTDKLHSLLQGARGHHHRVLLRCVEGSQDTIKALLKKTAERGFINYFWLDRFSVGTNRFFDMAVLAARGDYLKSIGALLHCVAESNGVHYDHFLKYLNADPSTVPGTAQTWATTAKHMRSPNWIVQLLRGLHKYHADAECGKSSYLAELWSALPMREALRRSAAEFVWNAMASQRLLSKGLNVVEGDVVRMGPADSVSGCDSSSLPNNCGNYHLVTKDDEEKGTFKITDVVLPVPYGSVAANNCLFPHLSPLDKKLYVEFATKHGMSFLFDEQMPSPLSNPLQFYRHLITKPVNMQVSVIRDPNSLTSIKSDLAVMQERKLVQIGDIDYSTRVREPCVYNVSERFTEKMEEILKTHRGPNSVVLSCYLPEDSSPFVMLREVFDLRHASFHDLYGLL
ncbi:tRNA pseudouridine synthase D (TruD), putative [Trypanosoma equiperdum]|uniref:tRNA pseudouridine synthase D (TruD), putative n=1 Tax=Trypanosoma equiperdum TaxID=5694 RepID=A0A1G4HYA5_TRYEQ|nr:tRNA pseudouridine synthase D (TruD), putative [Trypanosoma equiperdum]